MTTTLTKPTLTDLIDALLDVALDNPGHVYDATYGCRYTPDEDMPAEVGRCIIGEVVIDKWNLTTDEEMLFGLHLGLNHDTAADELFAHFGIDDPDARALANTVQGEQDTGRSWRQAVVYGLIDIDHFLTPDQQARYYRLRDQTEES